MLLFYIFLFFDIVSNNPASFLSKGLKSFLIKLSKSNNNCSIFLVRSTTLVAKELFPHTCSLSNQSFSPKFLIVFFYMFSQIFKTWISFSLFIFMARGNSLDSFFLLLTIQLNSIFHCLISQNLPIYG